MKEVLTRFVKNESEGRGEREGSSMKLGGRKEKARAGGRPKVRGLYMPPPVPPLLTSHHTITPSRELEINLNPVLSFITPGSVHDRFACIFLLIRTASVGIVHGARGL